MPVQVSYPGVYIQEVASGVHTITGVSTSIGAFFGRTAKGPINKAVRCLSFADFLRSFGGPHPLSDLAQSVRQFFDNGGTDCYVVRLAAGAAAASLTMKNLGGLNVLKATAKEAGLWANDVFLEVDYNTPNPDDTFNLRVIYESGGSVISQEDFNNLSMTPTSPRFAPTFVTQSSKLIDLALHGDMGNPAVVGSTFNTSTTLMNGYSEGRQLFDGADTTLAAKVTAVLAIGGKFKISVNGSGPVDIDLTGATVTGTTLNTVATSLDGLINPILNSAIPGLAIKCTWDKVGAGNAKVLRITSNSGDKSSVAIFRGSDKDFATPMKLGGDQGGIEVSRWSYLRPVFNGTLLIGDTAFSDFLDHATKGLNIIAGFDQNTFSAIKIGAATAISFSLLTNTNTDPIYLQAGGGLDGLKDKLKTIVDAINNDLNVGWKAELWGAHIALRKKAGTINDSATVVTTGTGVNQAVLGTAFVANVRRYGLSTSSAGTYIAHEGPPPSDGTVPLVPEYAGNALLHTGFYTLDKVDLFNLMILPGDREVPEATYLQLVGPASIYCNQRRAFLLVDAPSTWTNGEIPVADATAVNSLRSLVVKDHSAVFYPKVQYSDNGLKKLIGPSGMIAGLMARTDSQRGVWKAPAGTEADLRGVLDLEVNLTDLENGVLNKLGVNCIRKFPSGIVNWGARTLDGSDDIGSEWKYIPIRRLALFLEESLFRGTQWVVFEPNDEPLWALIRLNLNAFMRSLFRQGAFQGSTPDKAFFVKCDGETTTQNDRNLGIVNIEVGFAPLKPAEFVIIKIQQIAGDLT
jgi:phage tail sheath protein FI